ncbi:hypothetical protein ACKVMT_03170 [Halobacteriales archaeon Cl-PHB]
MSWVDPEYAEEFAVVSGWLAALVPWSLTYHGGGPLGSVLIAMRLPLVEFQLRGASTVTIDGDPVDTAALMAETYPGTKIGGDLFVTSPPTAASFYDKLPLVWGSLFWTLGGLLVLGAVVLAFALYLREAAVTERLPLDPVPAMGWLLAGATVALAGAIVCYFLARGLVGIPVPVGVVVTGILAGVLLGFDRD